MKIYIFIVNTMTLRLIVNKQLINVCVCVNSVHLWKLNRIVEEISRSVDSSTCVVTYYVFLDKIYNRVRVAQLYSMDYPQCMFLFRYIDNSMNKELAGKYTELSKYVYFDTADRCVEDVRLDMVSKVYDRIGNLDALGMCFVDREHISQIFNELGEKLPIVQTECIEGKTFLKLVDGRYLRFEKQESSVGGTYTVSFSLTRPVDVPECSLIETNNKKGEWAIRVNDHYLGAPNKNRMLYLYPNDGEYTRFVALTSNTYVYDGYLFDRSKFEIVVARYQENADWIAPYRDLVTMYTKCQDSPAPDAARTVPLPNVGRESHTYLRHIIDNFDTLSANTLFTQCGIYEHDTYSIHEYMECVDKYLFYIKNFGTIYAKDRKYGFLRHKGKWLSEYMSGDMLRESMTFQQWWHKYVKKTLPHINRYKFSDGAIFSVSKRNITENSIEYYKDLIRSVDEHRNPESTHYFERAWYYIFNGDE